MDLKKLIIMVLNMIGMIEALIAINPLIKKEIIDFL